ncbi:Hint domain-containing protein [Candidatus Rhodobacter oscarellae]|nr:Hint domain-containing protein [Candidatus Rhodobacter lobularis]
MGQTVFNGTVNAPLTLAGRIGNATMDVTFVGPNDGTSNVVRVAGGGANLGNFSFTDVVGSFSAIRFTPTAFTGSNASFFLTSLNATLSCFCEGTRIATPQGFSLVEDLCDGDLLATADGGTTTVRWLGRSTIDTPLAHPAKVNPIRISAGALGNERDLLLSPDHGVYLDGYLVNAGALVNGETIYQVAKMPESFTYYHVETDGHELILAEGLAAETYLPQHQELAFDNDATRPAREIPEMDLPRITSARLLPAGLGIRAAA